MNTQRPDRRIAKLIGIIVAAIAPPALLAKFSANPLHRSLLLTIIALAIYEILVGLIAFGAPIYSELKKRWTVRIVDSLDAWLQRSLSRYTRVYLRHIRAANGYVDLKGLTTRGEYTLSLDDVFISLKLESNALHALSPNPVDYTAVTKRGDAQSIWFWINQAKSQGVPLAIIGPPGSGKTTLLKHVAFILAGGGRTNSKYKTLRKLPVLIALRDHKEKFLDVAPSLEELIRVCLLDLAKKEPPRWVESQLRRNRLLVMLDGLDEIADSTVRHNMAQWADHLLSAYPGLCIIVTSRPFGYRDNPLATATVLQVQPFSEDQVENFLRRWYSATSIRSYGADNDASRLAAKNGYDDLIRKLEEATYLLELATNPLLLTMIANVHHYRGALPGSRSELYKEVCEVFLGKRHQARGIVSDLPAAQKQAVLQTLAFDMMDRQVRDVSLEDACQIIKPALANVAPATSPSDFLRRVEESSGLLIERERDSYAFAHLTFQEYLASTYVRDRGLVAVLVNNTTDSWWRETIRLYSAQADATSLIKRCLQESASNPYALALAVDCAEEGREVHPEVRTQLSALLSPSDLRSNVASRRTAGLVRLMLRIRSLRRVHRDVFLSPRLISHLEYQVFLDERPDGVARIPDHWTTEIYPEGAEETPIIGIRHSDASAFCKWLAAQFADNWRYRLPFGFELSSPSARDILNSFAKGQAKFLWSTTWTINVVNETAVTASDDSDDNSVEESSTAVVDVHNGLGRTIRANIVASPNSTPLGDSEMPIAILKDQLRRDISESEREAKVSTKSFRSVVQHDDMEADLSYITCYTDSSKHMQRLEEAWNETRIFDVDTLLHQIQLLPDTTTNMLGAVTYVKRLNLNITALKNLTAVALNRSVDPAKRLEYLRDYRFMARAYSLACGTMIAQFEDSTGRSSRGLKRIWNRSIGSIGAYRSTRASIHGVGATRRAFLLTRRALKSSNSRTAANTLARIYVGLVILEGRLTGQIQPSEGLAFVRTSTNAALTFQFDVESDLITQL